MTNEEIANYIYHQFQSETGIILGIPAFCREGVMALMILACSMAREDERKQGEGE